MTVIREFYPDLVSQGSMAAQPYVVQQSVPSTPYYVSLPTTTSAPMQYVSHQLSNPVQVVSSPAVTATNKTAYALVPYSPQPLVSPVSTAGPVVQYTAPSAVVLAAAVDGSDWQSPYEVPVTPLPVSNRKHAVYGLPCAPRSLMETDLGDILLVSEFPNTVRHARLALAPVLEQINTQRSAQGLHPVGVHVVTVAHRQQKIVVDKYRHLAILCMPGSTIKHINDPRDATDYKYIYNQLANGRNEVLVFVVGQLTCPRLFAANTGLRPIANHGGICDPLLRDSGVFQGDAVGLEKLKRGLCVSFVQNLNTAQITFLSALMHEMARRSVPMQKPKAEYESF